MNGSVPRSCRPARANKFGPAALVLFALLATLALAPACAAYPDQPMTIIVPCTPGTGTDTLAGVLGDNPAQKFGVPVVVDNRPGASGNIGTEAASKSPADGYTLLMQATTYVTNPALQGSVPYDPVKGFTPIGPT